MEKNLNKWEKCFIDFLDLIEFTLDMDEEGFFLIDKQEANLGDIESDRFETASDVIDRLDSYIEDYIIADLTDAIEEEGLDDDVDYSTWEDIFKVSSKLSDDYTADREMLEMILYHSNDISLDTVFDELCGCTFTAYVYDEDGTLLDESTFDDVLDAIDFATDRNWDEVENDATGEIVWSR